METHLDQIRAALADDATDDAREAGADACRAILVALDARRSPPATTSSASTNTSPTPPTASATSPPAPQPPPTAARAAAAAPTPNDVRARATLGELPALVALRAAPREQILDYVIGKLKALQPDTPPGPAAVASAVSALRTLSLDQLVDLGVAKLRTAFVPRASPAPVTPPVLPAGGPFAPGVGQVMPDGTRVIHLAPVNPGRRMP